MKVLVTGHTGFIGQNLLPHLEAVGYPVVGVESVWDVDIEAKVKDADAIVHLAAMSGIPACEADWFGAVSANIAQSWVLLQLIKRDNPTCRIILASSMAVLAGHHDRIILTEYMHAKPASIYGETKATMEMIGMGYHLRHDLPVTILRFANVYGPHSWDKTSLVASLCRAALDGHPLPVYGDGLARRDFLYVEDLCDGIQKALESTEAIGKIIHMGGPKAVQVYTVASEIADLTDGIIKMLPARDGDVMGSESSNELAKKLLGWEPQTELKEGLRRTWDWFQREGQLASIHSGG